MELLMENKWKLPPPSSSSSSSSSSKKASRSCRRGSLSQRAAAPTAPNSFSTRVTSLVKEQRARFYIMRRCVTMLICWRDY